MTDGDVVDGTYRMTFCHACRAVANFKIFLNGDWVLAEKHVDLVKINNLWVCDTDTCKRKAKLKAFW